MEKDQNEMDEVDSIVKWDNILTILSTHYSEKYATHIERRHIVNALFILLEEKYDLRCPGDVWSINLELDEAKELLNDFDFEILLNEIETDADIVPESIRIEYKARFKVKGLSWIIHQYDSDPFPSVPHAHQLENNIKLDLSNGKCYKKKVYVYTISTKDFRLIREKASAVYKGELPRLEL
jgi:hypothetical protein